MTNAEIQQAKESATSELVRAARSFGVDGCGLLRVLGNAVISRPGMEGDALDSFKRLTDIAQKARRAVDALYRAECAEHGHMIPSPDLFA